MGRGWNGEELSWSPLRDPYDLDHFTIISREAILVLDGWGEECKKWGRSSFYLLLTGIWVVPPLRLV